MSISLNSCGKTRQRFVLSMTFLRFLSETICYLCLITEQRFPKDRRHSDINQMLSIYSKFISVRTQKKKERESK